MVYVSNDRIATVVLGAICLIFLLIGTEGLKGYAFGGKDFYWFDFFFVIVLILLIISSILLILDCIGLMSSRLIQILDFIYHLIGGILLLVAAIIFLVALCRSAKADAWQWWMLLISDILGIINSILYIYIGAHLCMH